MLKFAALLAVLGCALVWFNPPTHALVAIVGDGPKHTASSGIAFDSAADLGNNSGSGNFSTSYNNPAGNLLVVCVAGSDGSDSSPVATYNSVSMTQINTWGSGLGTRWTYQFSLLSPDTGSHTLAITQTGGNYLIVTAADYTGVGLSGQPDSTGATSTGTSVTSLDTPITIVDGTSWVVLCSSASSSMTGNGSNMTSRTHDVAFSNLNMLDSAAVIGSSGVFNANAHASSTVTGMAGVAVAYHP